MTDGQVVYFFRHGFLHTLIVLKKFTTLKKIG